MTSIPAIVFIGGTGRSGTNVTKQLLGRHPEVSALEFEHRLLIDPDGPVDFYESVNATWSPYNVDRRLKRLEAFLRGLAAPGGIANVASAWIKTADPRGLKLTGRAYAGWDLSAHFPGYLAAVDELLGDLTAFTYRGAWVGSPSFTPKPTLAFAPPYDRAELAARFGAFFHSLVTAHLAAVQRRLFVEDNTWNLLYASALHDFCPKAKFVHVVRDPRDVVASLLKQRWSPRSLPEAATWYEAVIARSVEQAQKLPPETILELRLEDLIADPERESRRLCTFADLPWNAAVLDEPLTRESLGRWRRELDNDDQTWLERRLASWVERFGYT